MILPLSVCLLGGRIYYLFMLIWTQYLTIILKKLKDRILCRKLWQLMSTILSEPV